MKHKVSCTWMHVAWAWPCLRSRGGGAGLPVVPRGNRGGIWGLDPVLSGHGAHPCPDNTMLLGHGFWCPVNKCCLGTGCCLGMLYWASSSRSDSSGGVIVSSETWIQIFEQLIHLVICNHYTAKAIDTPSLDKSTTACSVGGPLFFWRPGGTNGMSSSLSSSSEYANWSAFERYLACRQSRDLLSTSDLTEAIDTPGKLQSLHTKCNCHHVKKWLSLFTLTYMHRRSMPSHCESIECPWTPVCCHGRCRSPWVSLSSGQLSWGTTTMPMHSAQWNPHKRRGPSSSCNKIKWKTSNSLWMAFVCQSILLSNCNWYK